MISNGRRSGSTRRRVAVVVVDMVLDGSSVVVGRTAQEVAAATTIGGAGGQKQLAVGDGLSVGPLYTFSGDTDDGYEVATATAAAVAATGALFPAVRAAELRPAPAAAGLSPAPAALPGLASSSPMALLTSSVTLTGTHFAETAALAAPFLSLLPN